MTIRLQALLLTLFVSFLLPLSVLAQVGQAELRGGVLDESGAALPGATITATHVDTGTVRTTVTSATGTYVMPALPIGVYKFSAELAGFGTLTKEGIRLAVGDSASLSVTLKVASVAETITVQGESPLVDTKKSELSGRVEQRQVESLPVNGRDWLGRADDPADQLLRGAGDASAAESGALWASVTRLHEHHDDQLDRQIGVRRPAGGADRPDQARHARRHLHAVAHLRQSQRQPRRHADQLVQPRRRVHLRQRGSAQSSGRQRRHDPAVQRAGVGDSLPRLAPPDQRQHHLDPFGLCYTGRWLDAAGNTLPRDSERTGCDACFPVTTNGVTTLEGVSGWDRKLDLRFAKSVKIQHLTLQGMVDVFNVLNIRNATGYTANYFSRTYLQPSSSTNLFYQPRQIQFGFRVSY